MATQFFTAFYTAPRLVNEDLVHTSCSFDSLSSSARVFFRRAVSYRLACAVGALLVTTVLTAFADAQTAEKTAPQDAKQDMRQSGSSQPAETEKNAAQIELLETKYRFESNGDSRKEVHTRVRINNELGVRQFARLNFDFNRSFQAVEIPLVRITHPSGGTADILPSAITDNPNPAVVDAPAYQDVRVKSVRILGLQPGDLLEYRVITTTTHHPLAPDFWLDHTFDRAGIVTQENFELDLPGGAASTSTMGLTFGRQPVVYLGVPCTSYQNSGGENSARSIYRWELSSARKIPPPTEDDGLPTPDVIVSSFSDWFDLVSRVAPRFPNWTAQDHKDAQTKLLSIVPAASAPNKMLRASYEFVSKLATVDLTIGATGFKVRHAKQILDSGYATPEEKCFLLAQFANAAGTVGETVFAGSSRTFARPSAFSHVFVLVRDKKKQVALDPSLEVAPFGLIPSQFRGKAALDLKLVDSGDTVGVWWTELPTDLPFAASQQVNIDSAISAEGELDAKVHYTLRGDNELLLRVAFHQTPKEKWKDVAQLLAVSDGFRGQITNVTASDPYATKEPFVVEYEITQPKFIDWSKKPVRIPAFLPSPGLPDPTSSSRDSASKKFIDLGTPLQIDLDATVTMPEGTTAQAPTGTSVDRDYATFSSKYSAQGNTVHATRKLHFISREIPATRTGDLNAFLHAVQADQTQLFTLQRSDTSAK